MPTRTQMFFTSASSAAGHSIQLILIQFLAHHHLLVTACADNRNFLYFVVKFYSLARAARILLLLRVSSSVETSRRPLE